MHYFTHKVIPYFFKIISQCQASLPYLSPFKLDWSEEILVLTQCYPEIVEKRKHVQMNDNSRDMFKYNILFPIHYCINPFVSTFIAQNFPYYLPLIMKIG